MKKPSWFRWSDLVAFLLPVVGIGVVSLYAMRVGVEGSNAKGGLALCWGVAATFMGIWARICWLRRKALEEFTWFPTYGFMVHGNGYQLPDGKAFDALILKTIQAWAPYHPNAEALVKEKVVWVYFEKDLDENDKNPAHTKVKGFTFASSHTMVVDFNDPSEPLEKTAFEHELGHVIHGHATGGWNLAEHHQFMKDHKLR